MKSLRNLRTGIFVLAVIAVLFAGSAASRAATPAPPLLLISMDAFRWDYFSLYPDETPHLREIIAEGISARSLISVYPSNTFPNHYSIVTGLYPSHHGIINNEFFDPRLGEVFHYNRAASVADKRWWGGEPIWVTAGKQGRPSASSFWVGSEAEIEGVRPTFWRPYDPAVPFEKRFEELIGWLHLPAATRPAVITFYLEETNSAGHKYGPRSPEVAAAVKLLDGRVGSIVDRLKAENLPVNIVIVSDHGMTPISTERVIILDDYLAPSAVQVDFDGPVAGLRPLTGDAPSVMRALATLQHARAYRVEDLPARFHVEPNPRNPPVWIVPEEGWEIYFRSHFNVYRANFNKGDHGYDPSFETMHGILIVHGPSFKTGGGVIDPVENIHIYNLLCAALGLKPAPNDGDDRLVRAMLR
jgi:predicted AlkP superfamily pyrophosphatase or phosphodiesterase